MTDRQVARYSRHILLDQVGVAGQRRLLAARVVIIGAGGLGSPAALYLAAAGVGTIGIVDPDTVDLTNLHRQILHSTPDVGRLKVDSAAARIQALNPDVTVRTYHQSARADTIADLVADYDFIIDGTDNFAAKFLINDAAYFAGKPFCHGGVLRCVGQLMTVLPGQSTCYRCVFVSSPPADAVPSPAEAGVLGVVPGVIGLLQATEALKYILGAGELLTDALLTYDALRLRFHRAEVARNPRCPLCGGEPTITELRDEDEPVRVRGHGAPGPQED